MKYFAEVLYLFLLAFYVACENEEISALIQERVEFAFVDPEFVAHASMNSRRLGRGLPIATNVSLELLKPWGNNVSVEIVFYEFRNNDYKKAFLDLHYKACNLLFTKDTILGPLRDDFLVHFNRTITCPAPVGSYGIENIQIPATSLPPGFPFAKFRVNIIFMLTGSRQKFMEVHAYLRIDKSETKNNIFINKNK